LRAAASSLTQSPPGINAVLSLPAGRSRTGLAPTRSASSISVSLYTVNGVGEGKLPPLLTQSKLYLDEVTRLRSGTGLAHPNSFPTVHDGCIPTPQENGDSGNAKLCPTTYPPKQKPTHANWVIPSPCSHGTSTLHTTHTHTVLHTHTVPHHTHAHTHAHTHTH
jgi:hypothetical protein